MNYTFNEYDLMPAYGYETPKSTQQVKPMVYYRQHDAAKVPGYRNDGSLNPQAVFNAVMQLRYQS